MAGPNEYDWQLGDLAMQDLYPDERGFQPTPTPPEKAWPVPTTGMAPWPYQPPAPAQSEAEAAQQARDAAAYQIRRPYQTAATRPPESNRLTAVAGAIGSAPQAIGNLAAIPGQTMEPNPYPPGSEEADFYERARKSNTYQKAPELAFNLMGSGTAFAQPGAAGMFGGKLSKTADLDAMRKAEEMVQYGKTASDIRKETNWFPTIGGILKYEIPDRGTNWVKGMEPSKILQSKLPASAEFGAAYRHPELFEAYPDLAKTPLVISNNMGRGTRGGFQPPDVEGELGKVFLASPASGKTMRDVALHEAGHVVQGIEDWPIGGSPFRPIKEGTPAWDIYQRIKKDATAPMSREEYAAMIRDVGITTAPPNAYEKYIAGYKYDLPKSKDDQLKRWAAAEAYRRSAGEVEARNIQTRKDYTKEQRKTISPEASQDVPYSEQIVERERRRPSLPDIPDDLSMGSLADQSRLQLSQEKPVGFAPGGILGIHPTSTAGRIRNETLKGGGYSVNLPSGAIPTEGLMVGRYRNTDPRNMVVPKEEFTPSVVRKHAETNVKDLAGPENYMGTWVGPDGKVYLDVSQRFPADKIRLATKSGERTGQLAGYNVGAGESFPIGNWREFVGSPEFKARMDEMAGVGRDYLNKFPSKEWWDMHGSAFERAYGAERLPQVAGFSAATAPVSNPYDNMRAMSEYMRRHIKGEPTVQPDFRIPEGGMGPWSAGKKIPLEQSRVANLEKAAAGDLEALQRAKVREEAKAMSGDPSAVVLDRHWARITEDPARGIFANAQPGVIDTSSPKRGMGDYDFVKGHVSAAARDAKRDPRDYSADVWTGIRETIKNTNQLFGTPHKGSAITGESKSYADIFQELLQRKAEHLGISTDALDKKLRRGDANLLSTMLASSPALWGAYQAWQSGQAPGSLAKQDQYQ